MRHGSINQPSHLLDCFRRFHGLSEVNIAVDGEQIDAASRRVSVAEKSQLCDNPVLPSPRQQPRPLRRHRVRLVFSDKATGGAAPGGRDWL